MLAGREATDVEHIRQIPEKLLDVTLQPLMFVLLFAFVFGVASAMIWLGTYLGLLVRAPDAVIGVAFVVIFALTFISNAFVPIETLPDVLQWIASVNPISVMIAAVRVLFANPTTPVTKDVWALSHPVPAAWMYCALLHAITIPVTLRRYRKRTSD